MRTFVAAAMLLASVLQGPFARAGGFGSGGFAASGGNYAAQQAARMQAQGLAALERVQRRQAERWSNANSANAAQREHQQLRERMLRELRDKAFRDRIPSNQQARERRGTPWREKTRLGPWAATGSRPALASGGFGAFVRRPAPEIRTDFGGRPVASPGTLVARTGAPDAGKIARRATARGHPRYEKKYGLDLAAERRWRMTASAKRPQQVRTPTLFQPLRVRSRAVAAHATAARSTRPAAVKRTLPFHPPRFKLVTGTRP